jgi:hypothetical protein
MSAQIELALRKFSGILTTNLDKTATFDKVAGRERRIHHSKKPASLLNRGEAFFCPDFRQLGVRTLPQKPLNLYSKRFKAIQHLLIKA